MGWTSVAWTAALAFGQAPRSFDAAFEVTRCADGWVSCHVDGDPVDTLVGRVDWGGLGASGVFSPFVELSRMPRGRAFARVVEIEPSAPRPSAPRPPAPTEAAPPAPAPSPVRMDCSASPELERSALTGSLPPEVVVCLVDRAETASRMTERKQASVMLMADAAARGDAARWEALARRHLAEIDASDPAVAMRLSLELARRGSPLEAHRMADLALENAHVWTGPTYRDRRLSLLKVRAVAARDLWVAAEAAAVDDPSAGSRARVERARLATKVDALEWLGFSREVGADGSEALALCTSAAGHAAACDLP